MGSSASCNFSPWMARYFGVGYFHWSLVPARRLALPCCAIGRHYGVFFASTLASRRPSNERLRPNISADALDPFADLTADEVPNHPGPRLCVFVHGCFWHRHPGCPKATTPKSRVAFWRAKFERNVARDAEVARACAPQAGGWP